MATISLCMIVKNEEDVLTRCLESVKDLVDEIIIVDTGSADNTRAIAEEFTSKVYEFTWCDDFSAARNYSFSLATMDYCMWLDADDVLEEKDRVIFKELKGQLSPATDVVMMKYDTGFDDQGNVTFSYYRERLLKNNGKLLWVGAVHEVVVPSGEVIYSECAISHRKLHPSDPDRNLRIFERQLQLGARLDPRQQFYYGRELYYHHRYDEALKVFEDFLSEGKGWLENQIDACCHCAYCLYALDRPQEALEALLKSFALDLPRAEVCCEIGKHFFDRERYGVAAHWYLIALASNRDDSRGGFYAPDCYGYLPCIQLCVCYSRMGDQARAENFNELAGRYKPFAQAVAQNRMFFNELRDSEDKE